MKVLDLKKSIINKSEIIEDKLDSSYRYIMNCEISDVLVFTVLVSFVIILFFIINSRNDEESDLPY